MSQAKNDYGVTVPSVVRPYTKTYHGLTLIDGKGQMVGRIQSFKPNIGSRAGIHLWELNPNTFGAAIDYVPGITSGMSLSVSRVEVWEDEFEISLGAGTDDVARVGNKEWAGLWEQTNGMTMQDALLRGNSMYRSWEYLGCWFTTKDISQATAQGDAIYIADVQMAYVTRRLVH